VALGRIKINLATFFYRNKGLEWAFLGLLSICVIAISAYLIHLAAVYQGEILAYSNKIARLERAMRQKTHTGKGASKALTEEDLKKLESDLRFVQGLITKDIFPWDMVLSALERNIPKGIFLDRFETEPTPQGLRLTGRAGSMAEISAFLKNLDLNGIFRANKLVKFSVESGNQAVAGGQKLVRFDIECQLDINKIMEKMKSWSKASSIEGPLKGGENKG